MRYLAMVCVLVFIGTQWITAADDGLIESTEARDDMAPATDPAISFWRGTRPVYAEKGPHGEVLGAIAPRSALGGQRRTCISCLFVLTKNFTSTRRPVLQRKPSGSGTGTSPRCLLVPISKTSGDTENSKFLRKGSGSISISIWQSPATKMAGLGTQVLR